MNYTSQNQSQNVIQAMKHISPFFYFLKNIKYDNKIHIYYILFDVMESCWRLIVQK